VGDELAQRSCAACSSGGSSCPTCAKDDEKTIRRALLAEEITPLTAAAGIVQRDDEEEEEEPIPRPPSDPTSLPGDLFGGSIRIRSDGRIEIIAGGPDLPVIGRRGAGIRIERGEVAPIIALDPFGLGETYSLEEIEDLLSGFGGQEEEGGLPEFPGRFGLPGGTSGPPLDWWSDDPITQGILEHAERMREREHVGEPPDVGGGPDLARALGSRTLDGFALDDATLTPAHVETLDELAPTLRMLLRFERRGTVFVTGHTDATGTDERNEALSRERAQAVQSALVGRGVPEARIITLHRGASSLRVPDPGAQPRNRRVEIEFFGGRSRVPGLDVERSLEPPFSPEELSSAPGQGASSPAIPVPDVQRAPASQVPHSDGGMAAPHAAEQVDAVRTGGGRPLPTQERRFFESRFGTSFAGVRIHTGSRAQEVAGTFSARAFTVGRDVVFGKGQYRPGTGAGRHLLAHELAHVVQQRGAGRRLQRAPLGQPQHVPEKTYIAGQQPQNDGFLRTAIAYHDAWGLSPQTVHSLQEVVTDLAGSSTTLSRIRIVTHASEDQLYMPLFTGGTSGIVEEALRSYADDEVEGLAQTLSSEFSIDRPDVVRTAVLNQVPDATLQAVGVASGVAPTDIVRHFIDEAIRLGLLRRLRDEAAPADKPPYDQRLIPASELLVNRLTAEVQSQTSVTQQQVQDLRTEVIQAAQTVAFNVTFGTFNQQPLGTQSEAATSAIQGNFAAHHTAARARFDGTSWIDVRGCQVGKTPSYLEAVGLFFGSGGTRPNVSGPDWYQNFPSLGYQSVAPAQYPRLSGREEIETALEYWSPLVGVRHLLDWLRSLYRQMLFVDTMRQLRALQRRQRAGGPSLLGGLQLPEPHLLIPPVGLGGPTLPLLSTPALSLEEPLPGRDITGGAPNSLQLPQLPSPMEWVRPAYEQLLEPEAELRMYLNANLVLPVRVGGEVGNVRLYYRQDRAQEARDNWLNSQWASATPGRAALSRSAWSDEDVRRVAMVVQDSDDEQSARYFSPDPRYRAHIKTA
jgi:outer membrane protein OmpA-like peptidoglycan-associated protein